MKNCVVLFTVLLFLTACADNEQSLEYGGISVSYSDESIRVEYDDKSYDITEREKTTESEMAVQTYDPEKVIDLFADVQNWLTYDGADGKGIVTVDLPEGYVREVDGYYLRSETGIYYNPYLDDVDVIYDNAYLGTIRYGIKNNDNLSSGDTFEVITACYSKESFGDTITFEDIFSETGHVVLTDKKTYTFPSRGTYLSADSTWTEDDFNVIINYINQCMKENFKGVPGGVGTNAEFSLLEIHEGIIQAGQIAEYGKKIIITVTYSESPTSRDDYVYTILYDLYRDTNGKLIIGEHEHRKTLASLVKSHGDYFLKGYDYQQLE
ncbi:MAG: hypothetical protein IJC71_01930 [Clostridia bacterium]|nr:hypothetical protein [Clostridia bacterium]